MDSNQTIVDIIILSYAKTEQLRCLTEHAITSLLESEDESLIKFNIIVIESEKKALPYAFENTTTIYPNSKFGYNKFMNIGIKATNSKYICLCNNDLIFRKSWASQILFNMEKEASLMSASPACSFNHPTRGINLNTGIHWGFTIRSEIAGWCLFIRRETLDIIGEFDERIRFWYSDDDYVQMLKKHGLRHGLVTSSIVDHLESRTLNTESDFRINQLTSKEKIYFDYKWGHENYFLYKYQSLKFIINFFRYKYLK